MNPCWCLKDHPDKIDILTSFWELFECEDLCFVLDPICVLVESQNMFHLLILEKLGWVEILETGYWIFVVVLTLEVQYLTC